MVEGRTNATPRQRQQIARSLADDALSAHGGSLYEAKWQLLEAVALLILQHTRGDAAISLSKIMGRYLVAHVERNRAGIGNG